MPMQIYTADAWQRLRDFFDLKGKHNLQLDEVIVPVAVVANIAPELEQLNQPVVYKFSVPATAGLVGKAVLINGLTTDTGRDIVIDRMVGTSASTGRWNIHNTANAPITPIAASTLDKTWRQWPQDGTPPGEMFADEGASTGDDIVSFRNGGNNFWDVAVDELLAFQQAIVCSVVATNVQFEVSMFGRVVRRISG